MWNTCYVMMLWQNMQCSIESIFTFWVIVMKIEESINVLSKPLSCGFADEGSKKWKKFDKSPQA